MYWLLFEQTRSVPSNHMMGLKCVQHVKLCSIILSQDRNSELESPMSSFGGGTISSRLALT
jgi:hypothetical protein